MILNKPVIISYIVFFIFLLILPVLGRCEDICMDEKNASAIVVEIEKCRIMEQELGLLKDSNIELQKQIDLLKQIIELKNQQIEVGDKTIKQYSDLLKQQEEVYKEIIKNSKSSFFEKIKDAFSYVGIGILIGVFII